MDAVANAGVRDPRAPAVKRMLRGVDSPRDRLLEVELTAHYQLITDGAVTALEVLMRFP
jgi:hypothetical protein